MAVSSNHGDITTDWQALFHVSCNPGLPELLAMYGWIRPQVLVPVHGELRHMAEQARLGQEAGIPNAIFQNNGSLVRLAPGTPAIIGHESTGRLILDGDVILPADGATMNESRKIAANGHISVAVALGRNGQINVKPAIRMQGVPVEEESNAFLDEIGRQ